MLPAAVIIYSVPWGTARQNRSDFDAVYRLCGAGAGLLALMIVSQSPDLACSTLSAGTLATSYQIAGVLLAAAIVFHGLRLGQSALVNLGAVGFVVFLYVRLHAWFWDWLPKYLFCLLVALTALALVLVFRRLRVRMLEREEVP